MGIHGFIDVWAISLGALFIPKYFREGTDSPPFSQHLQAVELKLPPIMGEGDYEVPASSLVGGLAGAFRLAQWKGESYPTIIYHHGASEIPFDYGFTRIFPYKKLDIGANLFLVRAPFHRSLKDFQHGIRTLANVMAMLAVSVRVIEELVDYNREREVEKTLVAGTSLGGFITNLHYIHYNSAHVYTPLLAGLAMDQVFLRSAYSKAVAPSARENPEAIEAVLNFEDDFADTKKDKVYPLLGRFDQLIRYRRQKDSYGDCPVATIDKGHTTGAISYKDLRQHVLQHLGTNDY